MPNAINMINVDKYWLKGFISSVDYFNQYIAEHALSQEVTERLKIVRERLAEVINNPGKIKSDQPDLMLIIVMEHLVNALEERRKSAIKGFDSPELAQLTNQLKRIDLILQLGGSE